MDQPENEVRRASGVVHTATRVAMAKEKARARGLKAKRPSPLEEAAAHWQREQETRKRGEHEQQRISRQQETPPFSLQQVSLRADGIEADEEVGWQAYKLPRKGKPSPRRIGHIPVMSMAQQVI